VIAIALGKIAVAVPGTPVPLSAALTPAQLLQLAPGSAFHKLEAWADTADNATTFVKSGTVTIATLPTPANGHSEHFETPNCGGNPLYVSTFSFDAATATQGPFVTLWVA
jgi:hypothetical protein